MTPRARQTLARAEAALAALALAAAALATLALFAALCRLLPCQYLSLD